MKATYVKPEIEVLAIRATQSIMLPASFDLFTDEAFSPSLLPDDTNILTDDFDVVTDGDSFLMSEVDDNVLM